MRRSAPGAGARGEVFDEPGQDGARARKRSRKRSLDAARGESRIGRAAQLRPGRLTFKLHDARAPKHSAPTPASFEECNDETQGARDPGVPEEGRSWDSDEHSRHSNDLHRASVKVEERGKERQRDATEVYLEDFYTRNPAAKANGWLALAHHRDAAVGGRVGEKQAVERAARGMVRAQQRHVLGLLPRLGRGRKK